MSKIKLHLGAGNNIKSGYFNHDLIKHRSEIDFAFDLNLPEWPLEHDSYDEIRAIDVIEHIEDTINFMNNCWRLLKSDGTLYLKACGWQNPNFWVDITHHRAFDIRSFDYFVPSTGQGQNYNYYTDKKWGYCAGYPVYDRRKNVWTKMKPIKK